MIKGTSTPNLIQEGSGTDIDAETYITEIAEAIRIIKKSAPALSTETDLIALINKLRQVVSLESRHWLTVMAISQAAGISMQSKECEE